MATNKALRCLGCIKHINWVPVRNISKPVSPVPTTVKPKKEINIEASRDMVENIRSVSHELTPDVIRYLFKSKGVSPPTKHITSPLDISYTNGIYDPYVPPEGDGKHSVLTSKPGTGELSFIDNTSVQAIQNIRRDFEEGFHPGLFAETAKDTYIKAHEAFARSDYDTLKTLVTGKLLEELRQAGLNKTIHWTFLKTLDPLQVRRVRITHMISSNNLYGQVTVRFHTQQTLAVYNRFGHLVDGSEAIAKDVLEYVVFEKHLSSLNGTWRMHGKLIAN